MPLVLITPPAVMPVTVAEVYEHLRLEAAPVDADDVARKIAEAVSRFDGRDGSLGMALIEQTWALTLDRFPAGAVTLPLAPLRYVEGIQYTDPAGTLREVPLADYVEAGVGINEPGRVLPAPGKVWPATADIPEAVTITFRCGYGSTPDDVPAAIRSAIKDMVAHLYDDRGAVVIGQTAQKMPHGVDEVVRQFRQWSF